MKKKIIILSIDGGGIRGIIPGVILGYLEEQLQIHGKSNLKLADYFDFIAGTSTGGILTGLYLMPDSQNAKVAKNSANDALGLYLNHGKDIFQSNIWSNLTRAKGLFDEKYSAIGIEKNLKKYFKNCLMSQLIKPFLITAYEITARRAYFFTSNNCKEPLNNFYLRDIARSTSAAPTYFEPAQVKSIAGQEFAMIDGGVFANNPTLCAYAEARKTIFSCWNEKKIDRPSAKDMIIISIGTGTVKEPYYYDKMKNAGEIKWLNPILDILMSGNSETVHYQLLQIFDTLSKKNKENYYRLEPELREANTQMDLATGKNIEKLRQAGLWYVNNHKKTLDEIVKKIITNQ